MRTLGREILDNRSRHAGVACSGDKDFGILNDDGNSFWGAAEGAEGDLDSVMTRNQLKTNDGATNRS